MNSKSKTLSIFLSFTSFAVLACAGVAHAQFGRRGEVEATRQLDTIQVGSVNAKSPTVDLRDVGRRVGRGVLEVNPEAVRGKRIIALSGSGSTGEAFRGICIGRWNELGCKGIYLDLGNSTK